MVCYHDSGKSLIRGASTSDIIVPVTTLPIQLRNSKYFDALLFAALALVWGSAFIAIKAGLGGVPPLLLGALRYDVAGGVLLGYALLRSRAWRPRGTDQWTLVAVSGLFVIGLNVAFLFTGQQYVTSATGAIVLSTTPVLTPLFARVLLGHRLGHVGVAGVLLGFLGVLVVAVPSGAIGGGALGVGLLFLAAVSFAFGSVLLTRLPASMPILPMQAWSMLLGAGFLHATSVALGEAGPLAVTWTPTLLVALAHLAVVAGAGGFLVYFSLLDRVGAVEVSLVNYAVPAVAAVVGWIALGESLSPTTVAGFGVIVLGFLLMKWDAVFPAVVDVQARRARGYAATNVYLADGGSSRTDGGLSGDVPDESAASDSRVAAPADD